MPPLGIGAVVRISDGSTIPSQDALNSLSHEIQRLQATKSDLQENMKTLHKYILAVFCLYCRHLCIQHKQKKRSFSTLTQHLLTKTQQKIQDVTQFASQYYAKHIVRQLQHLKFIQFYFSLNATQIQHNSNAAFLRKIVAVYCVFDRVVNKLDGKIKEKKDAVTAHILRLQQQYEIQSKSVHVSVAENADNAETFASVRNINTKLKEIKMEVDGDSDSELQKNVMTDAEVRTLQQLIDVSQQKNPTVRVAALEQLAALLPQQMNARPAHSVQAQAQSVVENNRLLIIQPTAAATTTVLVGGIGGGGLLARPLIILPQNTGNYGQKTSGYKRGGGGGGGATCTYYQKQSGNGGTANATYQTSSNYNGGGYGGVFTGGGGHGQGGNNGGGPINNPFGRHSQHIYEQNNRNNNRQRQQQNNYNQQQQQQQHNYNPQQQQQGNSMNSMNNMNNYGHVQDVTSSSSSNGYNGYMRRPPPTIPPPPIPIPIPMPMPVHNLQTSNNYFIPPIPPIPAIPAFRFDKKNTYKENLPTHNYQFQNHNYYHNHNHNHNHNASASAHCNCNKCNCAFTTHSFNPHKLYHSADYSSDIKQSPSAQPQPQPFILSLSPLSSHNNSPFIDFQSHNYDWPNNSVWPLPNNSVINLLPPPIIAADNKYNCNADIAADPVQSAKTAASPLTPPSFAGLPIIDIKKVQVDDHKLGSDEGPTPSAKSKRFQCNICNAFWFETSAALRMHVNTHIIMERTTKRHLKDPNRPWQCEVCNRKFAEKCTLQRHVRIHTNEKPWKCKFCSKAFNQSCSLQAHVRIHTGERPFPCSLCEKRFRQSTHRRQHMKRVHKQQWESSQLLKAKKKAKKST